MADSDSAPINRFADGTDPVWASGALYAIRCQTGAEDHAAMPMFLDSFRPAPINGVLVVDVEHIDRFVSDLLDEAMRTIIEHAKARSCNVVLYRAEPRLIHHLLDRRISQHFRFADDLVPLVTHGCTPVALARAVDHLKLDSLVAFARGERESWESDFVAMHTYPGTSIYEQDEADELWDFMLARAQPGKVFVLDLRHVERLHEYGWRTIMRVHRLFKNEGSAIAFVNTTALTRERMLLNHIAPHLVRLVDDLISYARLLPMLGRATNRVEARREAVAARLSGYTASECPYAEGHPMRKYWQLHGPQEP